LFHGQASGNEMPGRINMRSRVSADQPARDFRRGTFGQLEYGNYLRWFAVAPIQHARFHIQRNVVNFHCLDL
jgi:hypothetical protein